MIAWVDNGVSDGTILYTYFRVDGSLISWSNTIYSMDVNTASGISAAYFGGQMWIAYKTLLGDIQYRSSTTTGVWFSPVSLGRTEAIQTPTWWYVPHVSREALLIWTEYDND